MLLVIGGSGTPLLSKTCIKRLYLSKKGKGEKKETDLISKCSIIQITELLLYQKFLISVMTSKALMKEKRVVT